ncbi:MAG TPA: metallophosphoesterase [Steroidobacter sp.]|jgi:Icc protein|nr:metallophosphoesterase [Steroidobacteraceae bacterium]HLS82909.1 metallophosphoesterase [Steroidobacter sp.]
MQSIRLIQFSDTHLFGDAGGRLRGVASLPALQAAVSDAHRRGHQADAVLLTGDLVQDDPEGYRWIRRVFGASRAPVLCTPGNHDLPDHMRAALAEPPFTIGGAVELGRWLVVMLDSWAPNQAGGRLGAEQIAQLSETLRACRDRHALVCLHHHPIPMRSGWLDQVGLSDADDFLAVVREHPHVRGVLWGHVHQSLDSFMDGVRFMATPATCAQFLPGSDYFAIDARPPGYRVLELSPDGSIATEVCWLESYAERSVA